MLLCLALLAGQSNDAGAQAPAGLWQALAPGISYREFYLAGPNHVYVARLQRAEPQAIIESSISQGKLSGELETVRGMAERYDQAINYWGEEWGARNQVVVAINGYFFDPETGVPWSGQVHSGWYARRFDERQSSSGFAWTLDRDAFIGGCVVHRPEKQIITHLPTGDVIAFDGLNILRGEDQLIIYTPQYDAVTPTDEEGFEALVEMSRPLLILPTPGMVEGVVRQLHDGQGASPIPFDHIVLSASGEKAQALRENLAVGDRIGVSQEIRHLDPACSQPLSTGWTKTYASVGASFTFLREGVIQGLDDLGALLHNPRTAVAFNERYIFFIVVDGRQQLRSLGMSMVDLAVFAKLTLGATWGAALDGGGSTTMVVNGQVVNRPNPEIVAQGEGNALAVAPAKTVERVVANGLMMVVVQPRELSNRFNEGDPVAVAGASQAAVRLGPGTNYATLAYMAQDSQGVVLAHPLGGVLAKGYYWWKVDFGEMTGWVAEDYLNP